MKKILILLNFFFLFSFSLPTVIAADANLIPKPETTGLQSNFAPVEYQTQKLGNNDACYVFDLKKNQYNLDKANKKIVVSCSDLSYCGPEKQNRCEKIQIASISWLGQHVNLIYTASLSFGTVICVLFIMWAGFRWIAAGGNQEIIGRSKERISNALIGLVLLFGSYLILFTINPQTTNVGIINVQKITAIGAGSSINIDDLYTQMGIQKFLTSATNVPDEASRTKALKNKETLDKFVKEKLDQMDLLSLQGNGIDCTDNYAICDRYDTDKIDSQCYNLGDDGAYTCMKSQYASVPYHGVCRDSNQCYNPLPEIYQQAQNLFGADAINSAVSAVNGGNAYNPNKTLITCNYTSWKIKPNAALYRCSYSRLDNTSGASHHSAIQAERAIYQLNSNIKYACISDELPDYCIKGRDAYANDPGTRPVSGSDGRP